MRSHRLVTETCSPRYSRFFHLVVLAALGQDNGSGNGTQDVNGTLPADPADGQGTAAVTESASALRVQ